MPRSADRGPARPSGRLGVYVHVPFCVRHCPYCDFAVTVTRDIPHRAYGNAVLAELNERGWRYGGRMLRSIYFGGGTPGLWDVGQIGRVIADVTARFGGTHVAEVTVELNPDRVDRRRLDGLRRAGVTRLSFGVQSFDDATLGTLGRAHSGERAAEAVRTAYAAGFSSISVDVIYGVPGSGIDTTLADLDRAASFDGVEHVSAYELTWEPGTGFWSRRERGRLRAWEEEQVSDAYHAVGERLAALGFERYEVSNYARPGARAVHNSAYWAGDEYLGLGVGAHSLRIDASGREVIRTANGRSTRAYLDGDRGESVERLSPSDHARECIMVGLRTADGAEIAGTCERLGVDATPFASAAARWAADGWGAWNGRHFVPTPAGMALADSLSVALW